MWILIWIMKKCWDADMSIHPVTKICDNCTIIRSCIMEAEINSKQKIKFNDIPYNCPVARHLIKKCARGISQVYILKNHKVIEGSYEQKKL
jgi:hypothetical protein